MWIYYTVELLNLLHVSGREVFFEGYIYYSTVMPPHTIKPHYMEGERYTQHFDIPHSRTLAKIFLSVFYILP
jgi:hypothetical protein